MRTKLKGVGKAAKVSAEVKAIEARLAAGRKGRKDIKRFKSWSFSRYSDYKQCPLKAKLKHLDKIEEPPSDAMQRGADIGRMAELFIKGTLKKLPVELKKFKAKFEELRKMYARDPRSMTVEDTWAFTGTWGPSRWDDWANCVVRVKVDAGYPTGKKTMTVIDWKTGKFRAEQKEDYLEQLELYALAALLRNQALEEVRTFLCYLDAGVTHPEPGSDDERVYTRADLPELKRTWDRRTRSMLLDRSFVPRPNDRCVWCHYRKANKENGGGQCRY